ncbi:hypothetical protein JQ621_27525 [Bradyrhizobium manausense]|uniref:hypothetical protein n=1 Tax=Bradyrhizobium manausense TaxID=989370 RepID=UPI001BAC2F3C|nr:hypothetical protein [Bradyrhizobium manausense]MBR1091225.1 hypothetical protein [Bradyrhizobium manausense]
MAGGGDDEEDQRADAGQQDRNIGICPIRSGANARPSRLRSTGSPAAMQRLMFVRSDKNVIVAYPDIIT